MTRFPISFLTASEEESSRGRPAQLLPSTKTFAFQMQIRRCGVFVEGGRVETVPQLFLGAFHDPHSSATAQHVCHCPLTLSAP